MKTIKDVIIIPNYQTNSTALVLPQPQDIAQCQQALNHTFEQGYIEYITHLGEGILGGTYIRIYPPNKVKAYQEEWLERINTYYFWNDGKDVLTKEQVMQAICLGDTFDGDEIIFFNNTYFVLPRYEETIYNLGTSLFNAIEWLCSAGILTEPFGERNFEPFND